jgi:FkbM family methyltransferase
VKTTTIDDLRRDHSIGQITLIKLDVEGDEIKVLRGARESISSGSLPLWMIEFTEANLQRRGLSTRDLFDEISRLGYTLCRFDESICRLARIEWTRPVWYENYFATMAMDEVNQRLSECPEERLGIARDILRRGAASTALRDSAAKATQQLADELNQRFSAERATWTERLEMERAEWTSRLEQAQETAAQASHRAEEASRHLEESWRRIGEANWRADQAVIRAERAIEHGEAAYRRLEVADRRAANSRNEAGLLKARLFELLLDPSLPAIRKPDWAESFLRAPESAPCLTDQSGQNDPMQLALLHLTGRGLRPRAVLDVGAGKGYWSLNARFFFPEADYYLIDPLEENEVEVRQLCEHDSKFHYLKTALGDVEGGAEIYVTPDLVSSHCLECPDAHPAARRPVPLCTADSLVRSGCIASPDLMMIDVQGYELKVLIGAEQILKTAEVLIVEVNLFRFMPECPLAHEVIGFLAERGFVLFDIAGSLRRPFQGDLAQLNLVFVSTRSKLVESTRWE